MADPRIVAVLLELEERGMLRPSSVVDAARDPRSPLHSMFEWDDTIAEHEYSLQQARDLLNSIRMDGSIRPVGTEGKDNG